jgi:hypothetical protein
MNFARLLNSKTGQMLISIILGLGLATLFRKVCTDGTCLQFNGPVISEVDGKTYQFGEYCYKYELFPVQCESARKTVIMDDSAAKTLNTNYNVPNNTNNAPNNKKQEEGNSIFSFFK